VLLGLVVLGLAIARYVLTAKNTLEAVSVVVGLVGVLVVSVPLVRWLWTQIIKVDPTPEYLNLVADRLAKQVHDQWSRAADDRGLKSPAPIAVRWHWSPLGLK
jgi:hypothetical protein